MHERDDAIMHERDAPPKRYATCGACGCERAVTEFMRRDRAQQFRARPNETTDLFYCGCQNDFDGYGDPPGLG